MVLRQVQDDETRTRRLSVLVNEQENARIETLAKAAGLSVSAFLRACALGDTSGEDAALRQFDAALARMETVLDDAAMAVDAANRRMAAMG